MTTRRERDDRYDWGDFDDCERPDVEKWQATCHDTWLDSRKWCQPCRDRWPEHVIL